MWFKRWTRVNLLPVLQTPLDSDCRTSHGSQLHITPPKPKIHTGSRSHHPASPQASCQLVWKCVSSVPSACLSTGGFSPLHRPALLMTDKVDCPPTLPSSARPLWKHRSSPFAVWRRLQSKAHKRCASCEELQRLSSSAHVYQQASIIRVYCQRDCSQWMPHSEELALLTLPPSFPQHLVGKLAKNARIQTRTAC